MNKRVVMPTVTVFVTLAAFVGPYLLLRQRVCQHQPRAGALVGSATSIGGEDLRAPARLRAQWDLHEATTQGDIDAMRRLLDEGADPNEHGVEGWTPLHAACALGDVAAVELLLQHGADVAVRTDRGWTPLHASRLWPGVVETLIRHGADVAARNGEGRTPLHLASYVWTGAPSVELLLAAGAPVNAVDDHGDTPLLRAVCEAFAPPDTVQLLVSAGADVNAVSQDGHTALSLAVQQGAPEVADLLRAYGAAMPPEGKPGK